MASPGFFLICVLHSLVAIASGALMMFYSSEVSVIKVRGSTLHDQLLIRTSDSFSGLLLVAIGFLLIMVGFVKDRGFQGFFARGCVVLHLATAVWRFYFEKKLEDLDREWPKKVLGDIALAASWIFFLVYSWREKYD
ncbi:uncharacterized protein LOC116213629 [Punica granatum]|uniref:DUF7865 domain-containing protein n=2 Tax=Punica granatum TaxID=22663 RepID=A0A218XV27_PUNGR|nr:uncharacterized protein LOC116213629 [Punica granatum]OWM88658.1 hypothetical protein CDL15_Pgr002425 [Punica granatum]PKI37630.1 hypothetical protein CRG98_041923 [Punica granatum]